MKVAPRPHIISRGICVFLSHQTFCSTIGLFVLARQDS